MIQPQLWFDRDRRTIDGGLTLQEVSSGKVIYPLPRRILARSGQRGFTDKSWTRGKAPIPFSDELKTGTQYWVYLNPISYGTHPGYDGIGEAWPVGNTAHHDYIFGKNLNEFRSEVRVHADNMKPGSAGCIAVVSWATFRRLSDKLIAYKKAGLEKIPLFVV